MNISLRLVLAIIAAAVLCIFTAAAQTPDDGWMRITSNDGRFSVQVPKNYDAFYDKDGFFISTSYDLFELRKSLILNSYHAKTLVSLENYTVKNPASAAAVLRESEKSLGKFMDHEGDGFKAKRATAQTADLNIVRQYVYYDDQLLILTAASKLAATEVTNRFLNSAKLVDKKAGESALKHNVALTFSRLRIAPLTLRVLEKQPDADGKPGADAPKTPAKGDPSYAKPVFAFRPRPFYTNMARTRSIEGEVRFRVTTTVNGGISHIDILKQLPDGLMRQTLFAALRMKIIPGEQDGKPISQTQQIYYSFDIL